MNRKNYLTVCMPTYQQASYLDQAIESVLQQKLPFEFDVLISDDGSTDATADIGKKWAARHPGIIRFVSRHRPEWKKFRKRGVYSRNFCLALHECGGKYIALCEGDDFMIDDEKLARQIDFLESRPSAAGCFHNAIIVDEHSRRIGEWVLAEKISGKDSFDQRDVIQTLVGGYPTNSLVFRRTCLQPSPWWFELRACDFFLDLLITRHGLLQGMPELSSAYRVHAQGSWSGASQFDRILDQIYRYGLLLDDDELCSSYGDILRGKLEYWEVELAKEIRKEPEEKLRRFDARPLLNIAMDRLGDRIRRRFS